MEMPNLHPWRGPRFLQVSRVDLYISHSWKCTSWLKFLAVSHYLKLVFAQKFQWTFFQNPAFGPWLFEPGSLGSNVLDLNEKHLISAITCIPICFDDLHPGKLDNSPYPSFWFSIRNTFPFSWDGGLPLSRRPDMGSGEARRSNSKAFYTHRNEINLTTIQNDRYIYRY